MIDRETVMAALFARVTGQIAFASSARTYEQWDKVADANKPALRWLEDRETNTRALFGQPSTRIMRVQLLVYAYYPDFATEGVSVVSRFNALLGAVDSVFVPDPHSNRIDLGLFPQVQDAWIEGETFKDAGDVDGQAVAVIPVHVLTI